MADPVFLIDSDIAISILEGREWRLRAAIERRQPGEIAISTISVAEVMRGIDPRDHSREALARRLFAAFPIIAFDVAAAEAYRRVPFRRGRFDTLIAAHALSRGLVLVTSNERDFATVTGLRVENWTRP